MLSLVPLLITLGVSSAFKLGGGLGVDTPLGRLGIDGGLGFGLAPTAELECFDVADDALTEVKKLNEGLAAMDIHNQIVGNFSVAYGDSDSAMCKGYSREKVNENILKHTTYFMTSGPAGKVSDSFTATLEKVRNGVYYIGKESTPEGKLYILYYKNNVMVSFFCSLLEAPEGNTAQRFATTLQIRKEAVKTPLEPEVQVAKDEALAMIKGRPAVFGQVFTYDQTC